MIPVHGTCPKTPSWQDAMSILHMIMQHTLELMFGLVSKQTSDLNLIRENQCIRNMWWATAEGGLQCTDEGPSKRELDFIS